MIILYSGTPGSGKSLHSANDILNRIKFKQMTILYLPKIHFQHALDIVHR